MFSIRTLGSIQHGGRQKNLATSRQYGNALLGVCHQEEEEEEALAVQETTDPIQISCVDTVRK